MSDSRALVRDILMHLAAPVLAEETPPPAEALLVDDLAETLADLLRPLAADGSTPRRQ